MKTGIAMVFMLMVAFSVTLRANTVESVFAPDCPLSGALRAEILRQLKKQCAGGIAENGLHEQGSRLEFRSLERGHALDYFRTELLSRYFPKGQTENVQSIIIESREITALNHPAALEILSIEGDCAHSEHQPLPLNEDDLQE
jgi:hypothetical protein